MRQKLFTLALFSLCIGANAQQGYWDSMGFVELIPDESIIYRYVQAWDDESQEALSDLFATMNETGDKTIFKVDGM